MLELNFKTLKTVSYVTPIELFNVLKPEEVLEKNMNVFIQNSQKAMSYMLNVFQIMEHHWINIYNRWPKTQMKRRLIQQ
ncbi:phasin family protein [Legionella pneumophila 130b]|nr:phasin family protein [Legionella pneumophila 130b]